MAGIRTCDRESQVQRPNHYTTEPPFVCPLYLDFLEKFLAIYEPPDAVGKHLF